MKIIETIFTVIAGLVSVGLFVYTEYLAKITRQNEKLLAQKKALEDLRNSVFEINLKVGEKEMCSTEEKAMAPMSFSKDRNQPQLEILERELCF